MHELAAADLARSGIPVAEAERSGMFYAPSASRLCPAFDDVPALAIPYFSTRGELQRYVNGDGREHPFCRVRYLAPRRAQGFVRAKQLRYSQPPGSGVRAYFPPCLDWLAIAFDAKEPVIVTEGEKKALAASLAGFPTIALGGVWSFSVARTPDLLPELAEFAWNGREVYICFDSDAVTNPNVLAAEARLVEELQRKRGARCFLVRLPAPGDGSKCGLDDYLVQYGASALAQLLKQAPSLGALDAKVVALNRSVAWIERENLVYDLETRLFIPKDSFVNGSRFSAIKHVTVGATQRSAPKEVSVAAVWLRHPHATRYSEVLFRPGEAETVQGENGRVALNLWTGWTAAPGDVTPFLRLTDHLFKNMPAEHKDLALKLLAYKAQRPQEKIPLAIVLVGPQGCGKTLWSECIRAAFAPYGVDVTPASLAGEFQGWLETSLIGVVNEAKGADMRKASEQLKSLISDLDRPMNEKYRPVRQIKSYTFYIVTSNWREVGAFGPDDRRMIVVDCPERMVGAEAEALYDTLGQRNGAWFHSGGPAHLMHYLLNYPLDGWQPPRMAPMTAEKYLAYTESLTPVQRLALDMQTSTDHTIKLWLDQAMAWAQSAEVQGSPAAQTQARAIMDNIRHFQLRPWYTPEELALMFPAVVNSLLGSRYAEGTPSGVISRQLRDAGVPYLRPADDPRGFWWRGRVAQYLVVSGVSEWSQPLRQSEFERLMGAWPTYGQVMARGAS